jgi:hypothetical protein
LAATWTALRARVEERPHPLIVEITVEPSSAAMVRRVLAKFITDAAPAADATVAAADPPPHTPPPAGSDGAAERGGVESGGGGEPGRLRLAFGGVEHAVGMLLGHGTRITVVGPPEVRTAMRAAALEVAERYR